MTQTFSANKRSQYLRELSSRELDVFIIGGGITGAGIALDAVTRGLSVGLVEMQDFAAGTSSRSTKLVHGGLRYLKQFEIKLVAEVGKERAIVYENAPHVTTPEWMLLPIIEGGTFGKLSTSIGLRVYDFLAGVRAKERRKMLKRSETIAREPLLKRDGLKGGGVYVEYKTDDARLTLEVLKKAVEHGATAVNYTKAERFIYGSDNKITAVIVRDLLTGSTYEIKAKYVINAAGPWVDELREADGSKTGKHLFLTKGVHIVVDQQRFPLQQAVYFDTENDGRMVFAIPRDGKTYIGTTDTQYTGEIASPRMTHEDLTYLIETTNYMFPTVQLTEADVESSWAGLRPLIFEEGKSASEISRKDEIFESPSGLLSIAGGKLTGYRKMAEKIIDMICGKEGITASGMTESLILSGGEVGGSKNLEAFISTHTERGVGLGLTGSEARKLTRLYGSNITKVYDLLPAAKEEAAKYHLPEAVLAALIYGLEEEMVMKPIDFFNRRTAALFFDIAWVKQWKDEVIRYMEEHFQWSSEETASYREELEHEIQLAATPKAGSERQKQPVAK
ncbi:glycerol-3-phosphate dehydrogenase [Evansella caseinilytica]|uniref:Glycerol-3-phosphate dehydrogenase n=1 Tax=Evansella caseinilytica TaxID=1503961 RepID=A0A1H3QW82_9BACI|nr:glycerol-3-phosphate dehydrogenase/oxidase [Evansella caseinilytica]SDZ17804.1 glycerol-3-phosphate dehydrogenase [Evansella caseinilytica]